MFLFAWTTGSAQTAVNQLFVYPAPEGAPLKHDYEVFVQSGSNQEWTQTDTYMAKVNASVGNKKHKVCEISYCVFDFYGGVQIRIVNKKRKFSSVRIRPQSQGIAADVLNDSTIQFQLSRPENLSVEFDGNITDNLLVFSSEPPVSKDVAKREAKRSKRAFKYYAPGFYNLPDTIHVPSNTTIYLAPGSYFTGTFAIDDAENVSILGRGIARPERGYEGCHVFRAKHVEIDGLIVNTCPIGNSENVSLHDIRSISHPGWGDGLNVFASTNISYDRIFCRNSDDCTTAYATRKGFSGNVRNIHMQNAVLWADVAHPIFIGLHGNPAVGDTIEHLVYENIDILGQSEPQIDYQGCMAINCGDDNLVRDVLFNNIRIEDIEEGCLTQIKVGWNQKYCTAPGRGVENITFRNICYQGRTPNLSVISGYNEERKVQHITFEGLTIGGKAIHDKMEGKPGWYATSDYVPMFVGNHVKDLQLKDITAPQ